MLYIFTDGSCQKSKKVPDLVHSFFGYTISTDKTVDSILFENIGEVTPNLFPVGSWQIDGELYAVVNALTFIADNFKAFEQFITDGKIEICYDYIGIYKFISGEFKPKKSGSLAYVNRMKDLFAKLKTLGVTKIDFTHVRGHTGVKLNEYVDTLIKKLHIH